MWEIYVLQQRRNVSAGVNETSSISLEGAYLQSAPTTCVSGADRSCCRAGGTKAKGSLSMHSEQLILGYTLKALENPRLSSCEFTIEKDSFHVVDSFTEDPPKGSGSLTTKQRPQRSQLEGVRIRPD
ncbi:hypothetical protein AGIG_G18907 [Arapaima gigas]